MPAVAVWAGASIVHDEVVVTESTVICEYLDEVFPDIPLRPTDAAGRARMHIWTRVVDEALHPNVVDITFTVSHRHTVIAKGAEVTRSFIEDAPDLVSRVRRHSRIYKGFDAPGVKETVDIDEALANQAWLSDNTFSLADIGVFPYVNRLHMMNMSEMWNDRLPHLAHWFERVRARAIFYPGIEEHLPVNSCQDLLRNGKTGGPELLALCCLG